jgi:hypothetical protein
MARSSASQKSLAERKYPHFALSPTHMWDPLVGGDFLILEISQTRSAYPRYFFILGVEHTSFLEIRIKSSRWSREFLGIGATTSAGEYRCRASASVVIRPANHDDAAVDRC